jgi:hypothetical protein
MNFRRIFMGIKVKPASEVARKWGEVTPGRSTYYEQGAGAAGSDWEANTGNAGAAFKAAVSAGNIQQMFVGGVKKAGAAKYARKVKDVGVARFGSGVTAAVADMQDGITPFLDEISKITLPARAPRGDVSNLNRVAAIATTLHKKRLQIRAAGA